MTISKVEMAVIAEKENRFRDSFELYLEAAGESYKDMESKPEYKELMARIDALRKEHDALYDKAMDVLRKKGEYQANVIKSRPLGNLIANNQYIEAACCEEFRDAVLSEPENYEILKENGNYIVSVFHMDGDYYTKTERCPFCGAVIHMKASMGN